MRFLSQREHSRQELQRKLLQRGYVAADVCSVLDNFAKEKLQSDERFAEAYVHSRGLKGYGPKRICLELQQKGVNEAIIEAALANADIDWQERAEIVYKKKFSDSPPQDFQEKMKRQQFMRYRGFSM